MTVHTPTSKPTTSSSEHYRVITRITSCSSPYRSYLPLSPTDNPPQTTSVITVVLKTHRQCGFNRDYLKQITISPPCGHERTFSTNINLAVLNVHSLLNKSFIINDLILDSKLDGILLTETWLDTEAPVVLTEACPPNFNFIFFTRGGRRGCFNFECILNSRAVSLNSYSSFK